MLTRLSKMARFRAGWCIALTYLFCVLAPGLSFAFSDGAQQAPCITQDHGLGAHMHQAVADQHSHDAGMVHDHAHSISTDHAAMMNHDVASPMPIKGSHKTSDTRCCGLISLSAIPIGVMVLVKPTTMTSIYETECARNIADNVPPTHYRPPIS